MHDPIQMALQRVFFEVPRSILEAVFTPSVRRITIDRCIQYDVINTVVLPVCNLAGGKVTNIPLLYQNVEMLDSGSTFGGISGNYVIYKILPHARENRSIAGVHYLRPPGVYAGTVPYGTPLSHGGISVPDLACRVLNSHTYGDSFSTPTPVLLSGDTIRITPPITGFDWVLNCRLAYDENFVNMDANLVMTFCSMVVAATKAYIYNQMIMQIDVTYLAGGQELGNFRSIIESYADQFQVFLELVPHFNVMSVQEPERVRNLIQYMV